jgi:hypothetical protein
MRRFVAFVVLVGAIGSLAGCGGPITPDELSRSIGTLESTAAEGAFLADDVADDRTKATFARVHARDLTDVVDHEAEKLNDAQAKPGNAEAKAEAVRLAQDIDSALGDLQVSPSDRSVAREVEERLDELSQRAERLSGRL